MGWRDARSRVDAGSFKQRSTVLEDGFTKATDIVAKSWLQDAADEKVAARERAKEERAERKRIRNAQTAAEAKDKKLRSNASILAETYSGDPTNKAAVDYFYQQLVLNDGNVGSVETSTQARIESNQLEFIAGTTEPGLAIQGPNMPFDPKIADFGMGFKSPSKDARVQTTFQDNDRTPIRRSDIERFKANDFDTIDLDDNWFNDQTSEMAKIFADSGIPLDGTTLGGKLDKETGESIGPDIVTPGGVKITPYKKPSKEIDWQNVSTAGEVERIRMLHNSGGDNTLDENGLKTLEAFEKSIKGKATTAEAAAALDLTRTISVMDKEALMGVTSSTNDALWSPTDRKYAQTLLDAKIKAESPSNLERLTDLSKMTPEARNNLEASLKDSTNPEEIVVRDALGLMTAGAGADLSKWFSGISTVASTDAKILAVTNSILSEDDKKSVTDQLKKHKGTLEAEADKFELTDELYYGEIENEDGSVSRVEIVAKEGGIGFYSRTLGRSFATTDFKTDSLVSKDNVEILTSQATKIQEAVIAPMNTRRADVQDLLRRATSIDAIVKSSNGKVLTTFGGMVPKILSRIANEYKSLGLFVEGESNFKAKAAEISSQQMPSAIQLSEMGISAEDYSRFQAQAIEFAYVYARTAMGQVRTTDADFNAAFKVIVAGSDYPTFTKSLRELVSLGFEKATAEHDDLLTHPNLKASELVPNYEQVFGKQVIPMDKYLEGQDVGAALEWMRASIDAPPIPEPVVNEDTIGVKISQFREDPNFQSFKDAYTTNLSDPVMLNKYLLIISKSNGIPVEALKRVLEGE